VRRTSLAVLCSSLPRPPSSTLFPYTTLFRSPRATRSTTRSRSRPTSPRWCATRSRRERWRAGDPQQVVEQRGRGDPGPGPGTLRSEEHTSELQSRENLVCRLLLEKKKHASHA